MAGVSERSRARRPSRLVWPAAAAVAICFALVLRNRWRELPAAAGHLDAGWLAASCAILALSYAIAGGLWGWALTRAAGAPGPLRGARIWAASNLARYVPGNVWSFVGAVELARREGVARRTTLAVMALTQLLVVGTALAGGLPVLAMERARLGRTALVGAVAMVAAAVLVVALRRRLAALLRRRYPDVRLADLLPSWRRVAALTGGYLVYWAITGLAFAALVRSLHPLATSELPLVAAAYCGAYAIGFLSLLTPAGLGVREGLLVVALAPVMSTGTAVVIALVSRVWMMLIELAVALICIAADRRLGGPFGRAPQPVMSGGKER